MEISERLKMRRQTLGLTQETVAEKIHVSRQTISSWENGRSYPDIISVILLSDLYEISLDVLLKGDEKLVRHLEENTNIVKSNRGLLIAVLGNMLLVLVAAAFGEMNQYVLGIAFLLFAANTLYIVRNFIGKLGG